MEGTYTSPHRLPRAVRKCCITVSGVIVGGGAEEAGVKPCERLSSFEHFSRAKNTSTDTIQAGCFIYEKYSIQIQCGDCYPHYPSGTMNNALAKGYPVAVRTLNIKEKLPGSSTSERP